MTDKGTIRIVVVAVSLAALGGLASVALLVWSKVPAAELAVVAGLAGQALGALTGLLISTRSQDTPQEVTVMNPPSEPVNVEETGHVSWDTLAVGLVLAILVTVAMNAWVYDITPK